MKKQSSQVKIKNKGLKGFLTTKSKDDLQGAKKVKKIPIMINIITNDENTGGNTININLPLDKICGFPKTCKNTKRKMDGLITEIGSRR